MNKPHGEPVAKGVRLGLGEAVSFVLPQEVPIGLLYNDLAYAVMMATPDDFKDFALGFSLSEGVINKADELLSIAQKQRKNGIELRLEITDKRFERLQLHLRRRAHFARSGCGLCGIDDLNDAIRPLPQLPPSGNKTSIKAMLRAVNDFERAQPLRATNRSVHGAAFVGSNGKIILVREDIGRHNALDKLIGAGASAAIDWEDGFVLLSSRCTYELVQKCALSGISTMVCLSAPSNAAIKTAQKTSIGLAIFERQTNSFVAFANIERFEN
ncbi:Sulfur carrier protein FdhD [hydrothermal vent metagenome]|uniref:Sulfur carrier protein FdhD n=1 Tax=hydrothermal vent metagenome TaxID=652676 RepID=A0A3B0TYP6_9ZZZZ